MIPVVLWLGTLDGQAETPDETVPEALADTLRVGENLPGLEDTDYSPADSAEAVRLLEAAKGVDFTQENRVLYFARQWIGRPYVGGTLDRGREERLVVNFRELDCTTFVEQVIALAVCSERGKTSFADFCACLRHVRYIGGEVAYVKRQHYFTEWINDNVSEGIVEEIHSPNPPFTAVQTVQADYMTSHVSSYKMLSAHPEWLSGIRAMEKRISGTRWRYIPKSEIRNTTLLRQTVHNGDILVMLTSRKGLDTSHIGFACWQRDGLHLLNASSIYKKVVLDANTFAAYQKKQTTQTGIRVVRLTPEKAVFQ